MIKIKRERIYIIPTFYGFLYGIGILIALMCGAVYSNNLAYLLSFFLVALFIVGMHQSHTNLKSLAVQKLQLNLVSARSKGLGKIWLKSLNRDGHSNLQIHGTNKKDRLTGNIDRIEKRALAIQNLQIHSDERGQRSFQRIKVSSRYPFGLFYVWRLFPVENVLYVYPHPEGTQALPTAEAGGLPVSKHKASSGDDFSGHKRYENGESQKRVDWRAFARGRPLMVKEFESGSQAAIALNLPRDRDPLEVRLSQLARWIEVCESKKIPYSFHLGTTHLPSHWGHAHKDRCLKALAEYPKEGPS